MLLKDLERVNFVNNRLGEIRSTLDGMDTSASVSMTVTSKAGGHISIWLHRDRFRQFLIEERRILEAQLVELGVFLP
jgi:hypothetical protein